MESAISALQPPVYSLQPLSVARRGIEPRLADSKSAVPSITLAGQHSGCRLETADWRYDGVSHLSSPASGLQSLASSRADDWICTSITRFTKPAPSVRPRRLQAVGFISCHSCRKQLQFQRRRRVVHWIRVIKRFFPQSGTPLVRELLSFGLARESSAVVLRLFVHDLKMSQLMQEDVVQEESSHGSFGPLDSVHGAKRSRGSSYKVTRQADVGRKSAHGDLASTSVCVSEASCAESAVVEMNLSQPRPHLARQPSQQHLDVVLVDVVPTQFSGLCVGVFDFPNHPFLQPPVSSLQPIQARM